MRIVWGLVLGMLLAFCIGTLLDMLGVPVRAIYVVTFVVGLLGGMSIPAAFRAF